MNGWELGRLIKHYGDLGAHAGYLNINWRTSKFQKLVLIKNIGYGHKNDMTKVETLYIFVYTIDLLIYNKINTNLKISFLVILSESQSKPKTKRP